MQIMFGVNTGKLLVAAWESFDILLSCWAALLASNRDCRDTSLSVRKGNTLPTCNIFTGLIPSLLHSLYLSASSQPHFPLFSRFCGSCSTLSFPCSSEPFLLAFATFSIHSKLTFYWAAIMAIKHAQKSRAQAGPWQTDIRVHITT